jgi:hypothetical protein
MTYHIQVRTVIRAIALYLQTGVILARNGKPTQLKALATAYTGKPYGRGDNELRQAGEDLAELLDLHGLDIMPLSRIQG